MPNNPNLSDQIKFLIACCQTNPSKEDIKFITHTIQHCPTEMPLGAKFNIQHLLTLSSQHGILPLVYKTIKRIAENDSTRSSIQHLTFNIQHFLSELKPLYMSIAQRNILMSAELIRIVNLLSENSIEALAFKGPALSQMAYGDITLRQYVDLDILVGKEDIYRIDALLKELGYQRTLDITPVQEKVYMEYAHDLGLYHPKNGVAFEMHWSFLDEDYPMQVDLDSFKEHTQAIPLNGHPVPTFSNENLLYYLCIHGSKHLWERLEWIKDLDLLIREHKIDWDAIIQRAKGEGFEKMVYLGLHMSNTLFHTPLPESIQEEISSYEDVPVLSNFILESWDEEKSTFQKTKAMLKLFPGIKEKAIYLHKVILKPSFNEYWYVDLPKGFYWGYYLVRPYLLLKKYFIDRKN